MAGIVNDIHDSPMWKEHFHEGGLFHGNPHGIAQSLCLNIMGLTLGVKTGQLILCSQLFWATAQSSKEHQFAILVFVGIIPSQKNEGEPKNLDAYLEVLVDEMILFITY